VTLEGSPAVDERAAHSGHFRLTRALLVRLLGAIYFVAFLSLHDQLLPLFGEHGLLPARLYLERIAAAAASDGTHPFLELPTLFWLGASDGTLRAACDAGLALSVAVVLGAANAIVLAALWAIYLSFVHVGQVFYSFGWEILLLETGFLAIFLCPLTRLRAVEDPPRVVIWLLRWTLFRVMLGAGLIKLRGDECWRDLTCLVYHYETQPLPNPLSFWLHRAPRWFHQVGVAWNHVVELALPWLLFGPRRAAAIAGLLEASFQLTLIASGNLSFLNWLTLALCVPCLDDAALLRLSPAPLRRRLLRRLSSPPAPAPRPARYVSYALAALVAYLSVGPIANLVSSAQVMNSSFDRLHLVNTYGAFGSVGRVRNEVILEGTEDDPTSPSARWREYDLPCKPGDPARRPCVIAPYQLRLDWEIWFAAMSDYPHHPWLVHFVYKLLRGDAQAARLLARNPFPDHPPRAIRATLWEYHFAEPGNRDHAWWTRAPVGEWLPPLTVDDPGLRRFLEAHGWPLD
jgi:hypothetical protein